MNDSILKAILSMDVYNRGYDAGIAFREATKVGVTNIGNYVVYDISGDATARAAGFYAIAYENLSTHEITIAYRGTDEEIKLGALDVKYAYGIGDGYAQTAQSELAFKFYNSVADLVSDGNHHAPQ